MSVPSRSKISARTQERSLFGLSIRFRVPDANTAFWQESSAERVEVALAREALPQKSTDFYPKLLSGLTLYRLES
jgi:hypothetical protein